MRPQPTDSSPLPGYFDGPTPRVIAHRGLTIAAPENTLRAFRAALDAGATHLETDVHATVDGVAVLLHDADLLRVTGDPRKVAAVTLEDVQRLSLRPTGDRRQPRYPPTIDLQWPEVVAAVAVCDFRAYPAALLISQSPERLGKPVAAGS